MSSSIIVGTPESRARLGSTLGVYRLVDVLGEGAMGCVYLAEHTLIQRKVALKLLHRQYSHNSEAVQRIFAEARAVNRIAHENILEITDFVSQPGAESYYIAELLQGETLKARLSREPAMPLPRALRIAVQVAAALEAAHLQGIVHRDLKPENVYLTSRGGREDLVKLLDFGVAVLRDEAPLDVTVGGAVVGTPLYMSPEQAVGDPVDPRSDIFSFGVLLYQMLTGRLPFKAKTMGQLVIQHTTTTPIAPTQRLDPTAGQAIPAELEALVMRCLEREPASRFQSTREIAAILRSLLPREGTPPAPRPVSRWWLVAAGVACAGIAAAFVMLRQTHPVVAPPALAATRPSPAATVQISFDSTPPGAEVLRDARLLGHTPMKLALPRQDSIQAFELRRPGLPPVRREVLLSADAMVTVAFAASPPKKEGGKHTRSKSQRVMRGAVIEPYDD